MYLVSLYFDDKSEMKIQRFINKVAEKSENNFMTDNNVPPHITLNAFHTDKEDKVIEVLNEKVKRINKGAITLASIGTFKSSVIFLAPVLNEYIHSLAVNIHKEISSIDSVSINPNYIPFNWMPHTTIAKKLNKEQLVLAFQELDKNFSMFSAMITKIELSKTNPYQRIKSWQLI